LWAAEGRTRTLSKVYSGRMVRMDRLWAQTFQSTGRCPANRLSKLQSKEVMMDQESMADQEHIPGYGWVSGTLRRWWVNTASEADEEMTAIDQLEDSLGPLDEDTVHIRKLIGCFESCHHKAERHADIMIEAIGTGHTAKAQGRRDQGSITLREREYETLIEILDSWCSALPADAGLRVGDYTSAELLESLGDPMPLKEWQVQMVAEKIRRFLDPEMRWNQSYENVIDTEQTGRDAKFRDQTRNTTIHDTEDGHPAELTLAEAIDNLTGCSWDFIETIRTILGAIGGRLHPERPLALHARNVKLNPVRERMRVVCNTLRAFCQREKDDKDVDENILLILGENTPVKHWLAASLDKTMRLQLSI